MTGALFDAGPYRVAPGPEPLPSAAAGPRPLGQRQLGKLAAGIHPLSGVACAPARLRLHGDAPAAGDRTGPGPRCGSCVYREVMGHVESGKSFAKCTFGWDRSKGNAARYAPRISLSAASDVRAWWPACTDFEAVGDA